MVHERMQRFLTEASRLLVASLDYETTLNELARLATPEHADVCLVDLVGEREGTLERAAVACASGTPDDARIALVTAGPRPLREGIERGPSAVLATRRAAVERDLDDEGLRAWSDDGEGEPLRRLGIRSLVAAPLVVREAAIGVVTWMSSTRQFTDADVWLIEELGRSAAAAIDNARLFRAERRARLRIARMQEVTAALSRARTEAETAEVACRIGAEAMEAATGSMWLARKDGTLELVGTWGTTPGFMAPFRTIRPGDQEMPGLGVFRTGEPLWVESREDYARLAPRIFERAKASGQMRAFAAIPLMSEGTPQGFLAFGHPLPHRYEPVERAFYVTLAQHCSQALDRARLFDAERRSNERLRLLARAGEVLASSLDVGTTIERLVHLMVPAFADWCVVHIAEGDLVRTAAAVHRDPELAPFVRGLVERAPRRPDDAIIGGILTTGKTRFEPQVTEEVKRSLSLTEVQLAMAARLGLESAISAPIVSGGRTVGVVSFVLAESGRVYDESDRDFAEEVARRAGAAVEMARLYGTAQDAARTAETANRTKEELLATVSHELRTPLNAITGWIQMLRAGILTEDKERYALEVIERNAKAQEQLISDLLDVSRVISGRLRLTVGSVDIVDVVRSAVDAVKPMAERKGVRLAMVLDDPGEPILGDADRLHQIVWSLLTNAVKFTKASGLVEVTLSVEAPHLVLSVRDTGQGIHPDLVDAIFEPFRQADASFARPSGGLGLGLAITKTLVEMHGGTIEAASGGEGEGATFVVRLPFAALRSETTTAPPGPPARASAERYEDALAGVRILVVEDEPDSRELLLAFLEDRGATVFGAASVAEAVAKFEQTRPDLVVSDVGLPGEDGFALIRRIREMPRGAHVRAAALTAYVRSEDRDRALAAGFDRHVAKPIDPESLVTTLREMLDDRDEDALSAE